MRAKPLSNLPQVLDILVHELWGQVNRVLTQEQQIRAMAVVKGWDWRRWLSTGTSTGAWGT